jgi:alanine racemase
LPRVLNPTSSKTCSSAQQVTQSTFAEIDLSAIAYNLHGVRKRVGRGVKILAVVKANAYGHGIQQVSKFVMQHRCADYLGVAFPEEGVQIREAGVKAPIHAFALPSKRQVELFFDYHIEPTISTIHETQWLNTVGQKRKKSISVHLKIDTGMGRLGVTVEELPEFLKTLARLPRIEIKGVFTHFATADETDKTFSKTQLSNFHHALEILLKHGVEPELIHCANSATILDLPETYFSMVRPGVMMYGHYPSHETTESIPLKSAMTVKSRVSMVKRIHAGDSVSYGRRFIAEQPTTIANIPIGYADGYFRLLTNRTRVLIGGSAFPVVGSICMDQMMANVGDADIHAGDEVVIIGTQGKNQITALQLADILGTIPYEICCAVSARVPRIYKGL